MNRLSKINRNMRLAIVGSRTLTNKQFFNDKIDLALNEWIDKSQTNITHIVSGGARGADTLAEQWAKARNIETVIFKPDWNKYGKRAGYLRNVDIITNATHVLAFPSHQGCGTQHSIEIAKKQNKPLMIYWID